MTVTAEEQLQLDLIIVEIPGIPQQQGSKKLVRANGGKTVVIETNKNLRSWRADAIACAHRARLGRPTIFEPVLLNRVEFRFPRPAGHYGTGRNAGKLKPNAPFSKPGKPDLDKLLRALLDVLTQAGVIHDDSQVVRLIQVDKTYCLPGEIPGVRCVVRRVEQ